MRSSGSPCSGVTETHRTLSGKDPLPCPRPQGNRPTLMASLCVLPAAQGRLSKREALCVLVASMAPFRPDGKLLTLTELQS